MDGKSSAYLIRPLVVITLVAATLNLSARGHDAAADAIADQVSGDRAGSAPITLAQGRCFNGRCY
jgi:hypothetical protein